MKKSTYSILVSLVMTEDCLLLAIIITYNSKKLILIKKINYGMYLPDPSTTGRKCRERINK